MMDEDFHSPPYSPEAFSPGDEVDEPLFSPGEVDGPASPPATPTPPLPATPPPPLPSPPRRQPIVIYSQMHQPAAYQPLRFFYDPNTLYNEFAYTLEGTQEYIILIQGIGYEFNDNDIYPGFTREPNGPLEIHPEQEPLSICLLIRHLGPAGVNLSVAPRTSLAFLLENARVSIRTCYINNLAEYALRHDESSIITEALSAPSSNYLTTYSPYLRTTPGQQTASKHPLLLRRLLNLPKRSPYPPPTAQPNPET